MRGVTESCRHILSKKGKEKKNNIFMYEIEYKLVVIGERLLL
jgi:predicted nucleic acid-binding Zn ribbon protein